MKTQNKQKKTFKEVVKGALKGGLDTFKDQSNSNCGIINQSINRI
ncbi:hypothetical protein Q7M_1282 (plasmid) [Borrelia crocidurae str. Achema]|uniref:Uncharacterized protein n=1 Tax=Borrelia crocidurae (strain Achema) TaxID=1155096 RepID=I0FEY3_BORCA|nr:hypothetical protein Q7M_1282 [Borrelia crocidurae str. Achema]